MSVVCDQYKFCIMNHYTSCRNVAGIPLTLTISQLPAVLQAYLFHKTFTKLNTHVYQIYLCYMLPISLACSALSPIGPYKHRKPGASVGEKDV